MDSKQKVNDIFDEEEEKRLEKQNFLKHEYSIINSDEISMNEDDIDFIDNFSWDTQSEDDQ